MIFEFSNNNNSGELDKEKDVLRERLLESVNYWYYEKKVNVIPINWTNKKPNGVDWLPFKTNRIPHDLFEKWKKQGLFDNCYGIMLGPTYSEKDKMYLIGVDCDTDKASKEFSTTNGKFWSNEVLSSKFRLEQHKDDPSSLHIYFFSPIPFPTKGADTKLGLEVKGSAEGSGYMVGAPSLHPEGCSWEVLGTNEPITLTSIEAIEMIQHIDTICKNYGLKYLDKGVGISNNDLKQMIKNLRIDENSTFNIKEGERHFTSIQIGNSILFRHLQKDGRNQDQLKAFFIQIIERFCNPNMLPIEEITSIWGSCLDYVKQNKDFSNSINYESKNKNNPSNRESTSVEIDNLVAETTETILESYSFLTLEETKEIYYYKNGVYIPGGELIIEKEAERLYGYKLSNRHITETKGHIQRKTYHKREELDADINITNLENGLYDFQRNELKPHSPDYLSINQKPITYDPEAKPKLFGKYLRDVIYETEIRTAIEVIAYTFYRDCPFEHFFTLFGYGSNGKSVYTGIISAMHGMRNISNVSLSAMIDNRFALADLEFKDVNIDSELTNASIKDTSNLKKLTGGKKQPMRIERKNQQAYDTHLHAKLFFNTNSINETIDQTAAYYRRQVIINFPNTFEGTGKEDPFFLQKITSKEELSGIFNVLMIALRRLLRRNGLFLNEKTIAERREKAEKATNPIKAFLDEVILQESVESDKVTKEDMYDAYLKYCNIYKIAKKQKEDFGKALKKMGLKDGRLGTEIDGKRPTIWKGVKLSPEYEVKIMLEMNMLMTS